MNPGLELYVPRERLDGILVAIDPGLSACGWAIVDHRRLRACGFARGSQEWPDEGRNHARVQAVADAVARELSTMLRSMAAGDWTLIVECPRINQASHQSPGTRGADPNDLVWLGLVAGSVAATVSRGLTMEGRPPQAWYLLPHQWKGQTPKAIVRERLAVRLDAQELVAAAAGMPKAKLLQHNVWDAIGIALASVGRY